MKDYVKKFITLYGPEYVSHNIHGLLHIAEDVMNLGPLDSISALKFENFLRLLKLSVSATSVPLQNLSNVYSVFHNLGLSFTTTRQHDKVTGPKHPQRRQLPLGKH